MLSSNENIAKTPKNLDPHTYTSAANKPMTSTKISL